MPITWILLAVVTINPTDGAKTPEIGNANAGSLLARVLQQDSSNKAARPIGQCAYYCGDTIVQVDACPDGTCPAIDCSTRTRACPTR